MPHLKPRSRSVQCLSPSGLHRMAYREWGDPANSRVLVCVHGLTRRGTDFDALAGTLCDQYRVICPDIVGRGDSGRLRNPFGYAVSQYIADMVTLLARLDVSEVDWFGTSMGGLIGMGLAAIEGAPIHRMLLNDVGPRIEWPAIQRMQRYVGVPVSFASFDEGVEALNLVAAPFGPHSAEQWRALNGPMLRQQEGRWVLHYDPAIAEPFRALTPEANEASQAAMWNMVEAIRCPTLVVRGALSDLLSRETQEQMKARNPRITTMEIDGVGHAPTFVSAEQIVLARKFFLEG